MDPHHIDADPDPTFHFDANADPDPTLHIMRIWILPFILMRMRIRIQILLLTLITDPDPPRLQNELLRLLGELPVLNCGLPQL